VLYTDSILYSREQIQTIPNDYRSNALKGKKDSFSNVYKALLGPTSKINKPDYQEFLGFFALIRNTIHNNGKYMNAKNQYVPIEYREKKYEFKTQ